MISVPELHHTGLLADVSDALCVANQGLALEWLPDRSDHVLVKSELHTFALVLFVGDSFADFTGSAGRSSDVDQSRPKGA